MFMAGLGDWFLLRIIVIITVFSEDK